MAGFSWFQVVSGSFWLVSNGFRWFKVVPRFSKYGVSYGIYSCITRTIKIIKNGYLYILHKNLANDFISQECDLKGKGYCKARVKLDPNDDFIEQTNQHTHPPSRANWEVPKVRAGIKRRAMETVLTNQQILAAQLRRISEGAVINLPVVENIFAISVMRARKGIYHHFLLTLQQQPLSLSIFKQQEAGISFFNRDAGAADRIFAFASVKARQVLVQSENWCGDGTLGVFYKLYTFHAQYNGRIVPCTFALLTNKIEATNRGFITISSLTNGRFPTDILIESKRGAINAIQVVFANANVKECFFRLCSNAWKPQSKCWIRSKISGRVCPSVPNVDCRSISSTSRCSSGICSCLYLEQSNFW